MFRQHTMKRPRHPQRHGKLNSELRFRRQPVPSGAQLDPIVNTAEDRKAHRHRQGQLDECVSQVPPQQDRKHNRRHDEQTTHRWCVIFVRMELVELFRITRHPFPKPLPQPANRNRPQQQCQQESRDAGQSGPCRQEHTAVTGRM